MRNLTDEEAAEIVEALAALEAYASGLAATKATKDDVVRLQSILEAMRECDTNGDLAGVSEQNELLHAAIVEVAAHNTIGGLVMSLNAQNVRYQFRTILHTGRPGHWPGHSIPEHEAIVEAIARGDSEAASAAMATHLGNVSAALRSAVRTTA